MKYSKIENSPGTEDSSWSLATEKINLPCTPADLYFIYQLWECLLSVELEPQITCQHGPRAALTVFFCISQQEEKGQEQITT